MSRSLGLRWVSFRLFIIIIRSSSYVKRGGRKEMLLLSPSSGKEERNRIRRTFWSYLFRNVNRAVDELYYLCEAETSAEHCEEAAKLLESCSRDFFKVRPEYDRPLRLVR